MLWQVNLAQAFLKARDVTGVIAPVGVGKCTENCYIFYTDDDFTYKCLF